MTKLFAYFKYSVAFLNPQNQVQTLTLKNLTSTFVLTLSASIASPLA